jgi:hypothetical protein
MVGAGVLDRREREIETTIEPVRRCRQCGRTHGEHAMQYLGVYVGTSITWDWFCSQLCADHRQFAVEG